MLPPRMELYAEAGVSVDFSSITLVNLTFTENRFTNLIFLESLHLLNIDSLYLIRNGRLPPPFFNNPMNQIVSGPMLNIIGTELVLIRNLNAA